MLICGSKGLDMMLGVQRTGSSPDTTLVCCVYSFIFQDVLCSGQGQCGSDENRSDEISVLIEQQSMLEQGCLLKISVIILQP